MSRRVGVAVGKFNPPHLGHLHLVSTGAAEVDHLYVVLAGRHDQTIPAQRRAEWLIDAAPDNVTVLLTPDDLPAANEPWAARTLEVLPERPHVAFTSEAWGPGWASELGAVHRLVDGDRSQVPITATEIRADLRTEFHWLVPAARADLARRVVVAGAESTGKTTLAEALAAWFGTVWVPEYGRWYWEGRRHVAQQGWDTDELRRIAATHHAVADDLARSAAGALVVLDTDALVTRVWHERYVGHDDSGLTTFAGDHLPDLYLVCSPDFDWVQDGTRESAAQRAAMHARTVELVVSSGCRFEVLTGDPRARLARAVQLVDETTSYPPLA